jgi:hypothetical protein
MFTLRPLLLCFVIALPGLAQINSADLHAKLGEPLHREVFRTPQGFDLIADYGSNNQVCRIEMPSKNPAAAELLKVLVPDSIRGAETIRGITRISAASYSFVEYERVTIGETNSETQRGPGTIVVRFREPGCN